MFETIDIDRNGSIDIEEFKLAICNSFRKETLAQVHMFDLGIALNHFDINDTGFIDLVDFKNSLKIAKKFNRSGLHPQGFNTDAEIYEMLEEFSTQPDSSSDGFKMNKNSVQRGFA